MQNTTKCPTCNRQIEAGERVQSKRGGRVRHVFCPTIKRVLPEFPETAERRARSIAQARECGLTGRLEGLHVLIRISSWCSESELRTAYEGGERERQGGGGAAARARPSAPVDHSINGNCDCAPQCMQAAAGY